MRRESVRDRFIMDMIVYDRSKTGTDRAKSVRANRPGIASTSGRVSLVQSIKPVLVFVLSWPKRCSPEERTILEAFVCLHVPF